MRKPLFPLDPIKEKYYYPEKNFVEVGSEGCNDLDIDSIDERDVYRNRAGFHKVSLPMADGP